jgi:hypothetical protein
MHLHTDPKPAKVDDSSTPQSGANEELRSKALVELERIAQSSEFNQSEQSKIFLRFLVEHSLDGQDSLLRERAIGSALFHLEKGYDTNEHSVVRVRMNEVRKRLGKYYYENPNVALRFEIPAGSYRVEFKLAPPPPTHAAIAAAPTASVARHRRVWMYLVAVLLLTAGGVLWRRFIQRPDVLSLFWQPALRSSMPVVISTGNVVVYGFAPSFLNRAQGHVVDNFRYFAEVVKLDPKGTVPASEIVPFENDFVGLGTADTVARIYGWLTLQHKNSEMRYGVDLSYMDLRKGPTVLIDAFTNTWAVKFTRGYRFVFESSDSKPFIRDIQTGKSWSLPRLNEMGETDEDYVLISRTFNSETAQFLVTGAGITQFGTHSVGEILTQPRVLAQAITGLKRGWEKRNLQLVFYVKVYGNTPGPPQLIALYQW